MKGWQKFGIFLILMTGLLQILEYIGPPCGCGTLYVKKPATIPCPKCHADMFVAGAPHHYQIEEMDDCRKCHQVGNWEEESHMTVTPLCISCHPYPDESNSPHHPKDTRENSRYSDDQCRLCHFTETTFCERCHPDVNKTLSNLKFNSSSD